MSDKWRKTITDLLDGVELHLCRSAPKYAHTALADLRAGVVGAKSKTARKRLERELETFLDSKAYYRGAVRRHFTSIAKEQIIPGLEELVWLAEEHNRRFAADRRATAKRGD